MAQNYNADCYEITDPVDADMDQVEKNFECLRTSFSGAAAPLLAEGLIWLETGTNKVRVRSTGAAAWMGVLTGDVNQKLWIYRNDTMDGWVIDAAVTDTVLALRGGQYGATGGVQVGTWTQPPHVHHYVIPGSHYEHDHSFSVPASSFIHTHTFVLVNPVQSGVGGTGGKILDTTNFNTSTGYSGDTSTENPGDWADDTEDGATTPNWRPTAAVGTMQYLDVTP